MRLGTGRLVKAVMLRRGDWQQPPGPIVHTHYSPVLLYNSCSSVCLADRALLDALPSGHSHAASTKGASLHPPFSIVALCCVLGRRPSPSPSLPCRLPAQRTAVLDALDLLSQLVPRRDPPGLLSLECAGGNVRPCKGTGNTRSTPILKPCRFALMRYRGCSHLRPRGCRTCQINDCRSPVAYFWHSNVLRVAKEVMELLCAYRHFSSRSDSKTS